MLKKILFSRRFRTKEADNKLIFFKYSFLENVKELFKSNESHSQSSPSQVDPKNTKRFWASFTSKKIISLVEIYI